MQPPRRRIESRALRTPRAAGFAGIVFSLLLIVTFVTILLAVPTNPAEAGDWLSDPSRRDLVLAALALVPMAGVAFLWFVGVLRDRVGDLEDRFFQTVFVGSGLLFIAMLIAAAATAAGVVASLGGVEHPAATSAWTTGRAVARELLEAGLQLVGVFTIAASTILLRTQVAPRWLGIAGYAISPFLLAAVYFYPWSALLFPVWVLALSLDIVVRSFGGDPAPA